jgi:hypothetical protein
MGTFRTGSFVPFTIIRGSSTGKAMHHGNTKLHFTCDKVDTARNATPSGSPPAPSIDEAATLLTGTRASSACVIDFFEACAELPVGLEESSKVLEINRKAGKVAACRLYSIERVDRLEESIYWLLSAIALIYLLLAIIGL